MSLRGGILKCLMVIWTRIVFTLTDVIRMVVGGDHSLNNLVTVIVIPTEEIQGLTETVILTVNRVVIDHPQI